MGHELHEPSLSSQGRRKGISGKTSQLVGRRGPVQCALGRGRGVLHNCVLGGRIDRSISRGQGTYATHGSHTARYYV
jgi:hypothetical protein